MCIGVPVTIDIYVHIATNIYIELAKHNAMLCISLQDNLLLSPSLLYMLKILPVMLLSSAQEKLPIRIMLNIMPITTAIMPQFIYSFIIFNDIYISIIRLQPVVFYIMLCCSALIFTHYAMLNIMLMRKLMPCFAPS